MWIVGLMMTIVLGQDDVVSHCLHSDFELASARLPRKCAGAVEIFVSATRSSTVTQNTPQDSRPGHRSSITVDTAATESVGRENGTSMEFDQMLSGK
jgi:hypothetical protein